jgi:hypothetical protein
MLYIKQHSVLILAATLLSTKNAQYSQQTDIHVPTGFEPTTPGSDRPSEVKARCNHADIRLTTRRTDCSNWFHETHFSSFGYKACVGTDRPPSCGLILCLLLYAHTHTHTHTIPPLSYSNPSLSVCIYSGPIQRNRQTRELHRSTSHVPSSQLTFRSPISHLRLSYII